MEDDNNITTLQPKRPLHSLRTLKVCRNELEKFDPKFFPELRTLYLDENQIQALSGIRRLRLLENFSARSQRGETTIGIQGLSELRKVYLSGEVLPGKLLMLGIPISLRLERPFYNLQYLELAAVKLQALPKDFASKVPNVRILNLSFNSLKDVTPIKGMTLLKRLFLIGNRLSSLSDGTTETLLSLKELQVLDLRYSSSTTQLIVD
jgi:protein NUD1